MTQLELCLRHHATLRLVGDKIKKLATPPMREGELAAPPMREPLAALPVREGEFLLFMCNGDRIYGVVLQ
jgi:hypothetical protein